MRVSTLNKIYYSNFFEFSVLRKEIGFKNTFFIMLISIATVTPALYITQIFDNPFQLRGLLLAIYLFFASLYLMPKLIDIFLRKIKFLEKGECLKIKMKKLKFSILEKNFPSIVNKLNHYIAITKEDIKELKNDLKILSWPCSLLLVSITSLLNQNIELIWDILIISINSFAICLIIYLLFLVFYRKMLLDFLEEYEESRELNE